MGSDIDVIALIQGLTSAELDTAIEIATAVQLERGTTFSLRVMPNERFDFLLKKEVGFALDVMREGAPG